MLATHPLLDAMTIYGTQLALPLSVHPFGLGSIFIIDPLYTLPLVVGVVWALAARSRPSALPANAAGLLLSTAYLAWSAAAQLHALRIARAALDAQGIAAQRVLVTPTPFNTALWRVLAIDANGYHEGFYAIRDARPDIRFDRFASGTELADALRDVDGVRRIAAFSKGFFKLEQVGARVLLSDLRMGQEPAYSFTFAVAERRSPVVPLQPSQQVGSRPDAARVLPWLWRRALGEQLPPPR